MEEQDLLRLAGSGRVKFHESGELVFEEGKQRTDFFYVIQKGTVNLYRNFGPRQELIDVRVEGNLLGILWSQEKQTYISTAKTDSETILYRLPFKLLAEIAERVAEVRKFLKAYYSMQPGSADHLGDDPVASPSAWIGLVEPCKERASRNLLTCSPKDRIRDVAKRLAPGNQESFIVIDDCRCPVGIITESDLSGKVATGDVPVDAPIEQLMSSPVKTIPPGLSAGELTLTMLKYRLHHLCVTADGTDKTPVLGVITERNLGQLHGRLPTMLTIEIQVARDANQLAAARDRAEQLLFEYIETEVSVNWIAQFIAEIDNGIVERALELAQQELLSQGREGPGIPYCWLAFHSEGRCERLLRSSQRTGIVFADPVTGNGEAAAFYFADLAMHVRNTLHTCGFNLDPHARRADNPRWCRPLSEWKAYYTNWIQDPIGYEILKQTPFFDLRPVAGEKQLADDLTNHIHEQLSAHEDFVPLLANDAMANLPPVTIFRDSVVDKSGVLWTCIDTKIHALYPLVDLIRVLALDMGLADKSSTLERLSALRELLPDNSALLDEAREAFQFALSLQTRFGLSRNDEGQFVRPNELSLIERERIKNVFRTVALMLDFVANRFGLTRAAEEAS